MSMPTQPLYVGGSSPYTGIPLAAKAEAELSRPTAPEQNLLGKHMVATLCTALGLTFVGSGGIVPTHAAVGLTSPTGARVFLRGMCEGNATPEDVQSPSTMVSGIKAAFGVNVSQLAKILHVERQTLYLWMDEVEPPRIQPKNRARLLEIHAFADEWNSLSVRPAGKWLENAATGSKSLLDLMSAADLDRSAIRQVMVVLSKKINEEQVGRKELSIAERLRRKGFQKPPGDDMRTTLAGVSGTVTSEK